MKMKKAVFGCLICSTPDSSACEVIEPNGETDSSESSEMRRGRRKKRHGGGYRDTGAHTLRLDMVGSVVYRRMSQRTKNGPQPWAGQRHPLEGEGREPGAEAGESSAEGETAPAAGEKKKNGRVFAGLQGQIRLRFHLHFPLDG